MDFAYSDEQAALQSLARQVFQSAANEPPQPGGRDAWYDWKLWSQLSKTQLHAVAIPEEHGGAAFGLFELALVLEELGRTLAPVPMFATAVLGSLPIARFGTEAQQSRWLRSVAEQGAVLTAALIEAGQRDPARPRTRALCEGEGFRLEGEKECVPAAEVAQGILVAARAEGGAGLFLVEPGAPGVILEPQVLTHGEPCARLVLQGALVPKEGVLGRPMEGHPVLPWLLERAALGLAAFQLGVAEAALERTAAYVSERKQFGRPIGSFQGVALRLADASIDVQAMRATLVQAAWRLDAGLPASCEVAAARWWAARGGHRVVHTAQHLHGGIGADVAYPIHRYFLASKQGELLFGGPSREAQRIGEMLLARRGAGAR
jgi:alkylation response protein AidB-like acyl-CoA dehydrogenase